MPNLFQQYKTRTSVHLSVTLLSTMAARRRRTPAAEHSVLPKLVRAPDFDTCNFYVEAVNPMFVPMRVLLRRLFVIDVDRNRYVSVGFYPSRDYLPFVEFGVVKRTGQPSSLSTSSRSIKWPNVYLEYATECAATNSTCARMATSD